MPGSIPPRILMIGATLIAAAAIGGAWYSELVLHFVPCMLCLWQRIPYYLAAPAAFVALTGLGGARVGQVALLVLVAIFITSTGLGLWHAGVEWKLFPAPDCGGRLGGAAPSLDDFRRSLSTARVVLCDEAPMRVLGLSFAGWNAIASALVAAMYAMAARGLSRA
jgi:disulfide bond formation protein DsbB